MPTSRLLPATALLLAVPRLAPFCTSAVSRPLPYSAPPTLTARQKQTKLPLFFRSRNMAWREVWDKDAALTNACGPTNGISFAIVLGRDGKIAALGTPGDDLDVSAAVKAAQARP